MVVVGFSSSNFLKCRSMMVPSECDGEIGGGENFNLEDSAVLVS